MHETVRTLVRGTIESDQLSLGQSIFQFKGSRCRTLNGKQSTYLSLEGDPQDRSLFRCNKYRSRDMYLLLVYNHICAPEVETVYSRGHPAEMPHTTRRPRITRPVSLVLSRVPGGRQPLFQRVQLLQIRRPQLIVGGLKKTPAFQTHVIVWLYKLLLT